MKIPPTLINHEVRNELGLSLVDYCVADFYSKLSQKMANKEVAEALGVSSGQCSGSRKVLIELGLLVEEVDGRCLTTELWSSYGQINAELSPINSIWEEYCDFYNEQVSVPLGLPRITYTNNSVKKQLLAILRSDVSIELYDLKCVTMWKKGEWENNADRKKYIRPATFFSSSVKFKKYLEEAKGWIQSIQNKR